ncbi:MAG: cation:proton antiporter subunit C [Defluviitaleaceae bacterium]|nr:cation:proton antiporter subunit C [Defluviitaleaceae bacterium]
MELFSLALFFISLFGLITSKNMVKTVIFLMFMQTSVIMFWLKMGIESTAAPAPPIISDPNMLKDIADIADPLPQALTLTAIIIGFSVTAIIVIMLNHLFRQYGTTEWQEIEEMENKKSC